MVTIPRYIFYFGLLLISLISFFCTKVSAQTFNELVFFGDSLSDSGSKSDLITLVSPPNSYGLPPVTNNGGPIWATFLSNLYGTGDKSRYDFRTPGGKPTFLDPDGAANSNYAISTTGTPITLLTILQAIQDGGVDINFNLDDRFMEFFALSGNNPAIEALKEKITQRAIKGALTSKTKLNRNAAYFIWSGANDIISANNSGAGPLVVQGVPNFDLDIASAIKNNIIKGIKLLQLAGARTIIVLNQPPIDTTPWGKGNDMDIVSKDRILLFNAKLLESINALPTDIIQIDIHGLLNAVLENPESFGFQFTDKVCKPGAASGSIPKFNPTAEQILQSCDGCLYYDGLHPTKAGHKIISEYVFNILRAHTFAAALAEAPGGMIQANNAILQKQLAPYQKASTEKITPFIHLASHHEDPATTSDRTAFRTDDIGLVVGAKIATSANSQIGIAATGNYNKSVFDDGYGRFNVQSAGIALMYSYHPNPFFVNGVVQGNVLNFTNIQRHFTLGPKKFIARAWTSGHNLSMTFKSGFFVVFHKRIRTGPYIEVEHKKTSVNRYQEYNADFSNMIFQTQKYQTFETGIGWLASLSNASDSIYAHFFFAGQKQWFGGEREIRFNQVSLPGSHGGLMVIQPKTKYFKGGLHVGYKCFKYMLIQGGLTFKNGTHKVRESLYTIGLSAILD